MSAIEVYLFRFCIFFRQSNYNAVSVMEVHQSSYGIFRIFKNNIKDWP